MKQFISLFVVLLGFCLSLQTAQSEEIRINGNSPRYVNDRYGFSLSWTPGVYKAVEAENGDGITVHDKGNLTMRAYGTKSYAVMGQSMEDAMTEFAQKMDTVTYRKMDKQAGWFALSGMKGRDIVYVKCLFGDEDAKVLEVIYPKSAKSDYDALVGMAAKTFKVTAPQ